MKHLLKSKNIGLAFIASVLLFIVVKAATPYTVSDVTLNDSEFPRVQVSMTISGDTNGLLSRNIEILEGGKRNDGPQILLPQHQAPNKLDLYVLVDTSSGAGRQKDLIQSNLQAFFQYIFDSGLNGAIHLSTFDGSHSSVSTTLPEALNRLNELSFSGDTPLIDGFGRIEQFADSGSAGGQKVMLIVNASDFEDNEPDGRSGIALASAIKAVSSDYVTFVLGQPLRKLYAIPSDDSNTGLADFSHAVPGGYLGSFGADLTSLVDLLKMQSEKDFVLQYYSAASTGNFGGSQALLRIMGNDAYTFSYQTAPSEAIDINHLPENELVLGEDVTIDVDLGNYGKMINAVELNYKNKEGSFEVQKLLHQRDQSTSELLRYSGRVPADLVDDENFSYYLSVHTPYSSVAGNGMVTVPVNAYDDGIILKATLVNNSEVLWTWDGPTVAKGKHFEVWSGDTLLATTDKKEHTIPLTDCNRYQIVQVVVIFSDGSESYPSRPYEYYADTGSDGPITEKNGVMLMIECIEDKEIDTYTKIVTKNKDFSASSNLTLERAGVYLAQVIAEDIWQKMEKQSGYYELLYYIMIFINREEYQTYGINDEVINESLVHKLITEVNNTDNINAVYEKALNEIGNRLRSTLSM